MSKKKKYINLEENRYGLFLTEKSYSLDIMYGRHFLDKDVIHEILLYKVNIINSKTNKLYGQSKPKDKSYLPPVSIRGMIKIDENTQSTYGDENGLVRNDTGNLTFNVYIEELKEKNINFNRGDIVGYNMSGTNIRFYEVINANDVIDVTSQSYGGYKPYYKSINAIPIKEDVTYLLEL